MHSLWTVTSAFSLLCFLSGVLPGLTYLTVECQKVKAAESDKTVDDPGEPAHASKQEGNEIEIEKSDQSPVYRAYDRNGQRKIL